MNSDGDVITSDGRPFYRQAAATRKVRSLKVKRRIGGMSSSTVEAEGSRRRESMSATQRSSCVRYDRAIWCWQQKTNTASLNSISCGTYNQWRSRSSGVMWTVQQHSPEIAVCPGECLPCWLMSHCHNRGMSAPRTPSAIAEPAERWSGKCCRSVAVQRNIHTWFRRRVSSLTHWSQHRCSNLALTMMAWQPLSVQSVVSVLDIDLTSTKWM